MRQLAIKIMEAVESAENTTYDQIESVEEVLHNWQESQSKQNKYPEVNELILE